MGLRRILLVRWRYGTRNKRILTDELVHTVDMERLIDLAWLDAAQHPMTKKDLYVIVGRSDSGILTDVYAFTPSGSPHGLRFFQHISDYWVGRRVV